MFPKSTQSDKHCQKELLHITKSMSTKPRSERSRNCSFNTTGHSWLPIQEDASPRNTEVLEPEQDIKNLIDDSVH